MLLPFEKPGTHSEDSFIIINENKYQKLILNDLIIVDRLWTACPV
jgi:hypothetical protein